MAGAPASIREDVGSEDLTVISPMYIAIVEKQKLGTMPISEWENGVLNVVRNNTKDGVIDWNIVSKILNQVVDAVNNGEMQEIDGMPTSLRPFVSQLGKEMPYIGAPTSRPIRGEPKSIEGKSITVSVLKPEATWFSSPVSGEFFPSTVEIGEFDKFGGEKGKSGAYFVGEGEVDMGGNAPNKLVKVEYFVVKNTDGSIGGLWWREPGQKWKEGQYEYLPDQKTVTKIVCEGRGCQLREDDLNAGVKYLLDKGWISQASTAPQEPTSKKAIQGDPVSGKDTYFAGKPLKAGVFYTTDDLGVAVEKTDGGTWYKWKSGDGNYYEGLWANNKFADYSQIQPNIFKVNGVQVASSDFEFTPTPLNATIPNVNFWTEKLAIRNAIDGKAFPYIPSASALIANTDRIYWFTGDQSPLVKPSKNYDGTVVEGKQKQVVYAGGYSDHPDVLGKNPNISISELDSAMEKSIGTGQIWGIDLSGESWCNPCKNFNPTVDTLAATNPSDSVQYVYLSVDDMYDSRVDFDQAMALVGKYGYVGNVSFPTMIFIQDGKVVGGNIAQSFLTMQPSDYVNTINSFIAGAGTQIGTTSTSPTTIAPIPTFSTKPAGNVPAELQGYQDMAVNTLRYNQSHNIKVSDIKVDKNKDTNITTIT
jgi:thiol-disulfide isomerase/thioredoxin